MRESDKSKKLWQPESVELSVLKGSGIDIGPADSPIMPGVKRFDVEDGDANHISRYVKGTFDYVYASHCLEHMHKPEEAILEWWKLVKKGGHLFFTVPDEDLYEQGVFPSRFNPDHKATFTLSKTKSWSPVSLNVYDLASSLPGGKIISIALQDHGYDRELMTFGPRKEPGLVVKTLMRIYFALKRRRAWNSPTIEKVFLTYQAVDQTMHENTLAQISCIIKKTR